MVGAKHPRQRSLAETLGADAVVAPDQLARAVRRRSGSLVLAGRLTDGADVVFDCVGHVGVADPGPGHGPPPGPGGAGGHARPGLDRPGPAVAPRAHPGRAPTPTAPSRPRPTAGHRRAASSWPSTWWPPPGSARCVSAAYPLERYEEAIAHAGAAGRRGAVKVVFDLRKPERKHPMSPRPGFVLEVDRSTPPTLFWHGERFSLERLPEGSRVIYAPEPVDPLKDPPAAIRSALTHPVGDRDPLPALLRPGMKLTIAFDDISLPLPPMEQPDIRQLVIEQVLDMAAEAGVDDVVLIVALALHRRMTEAELRHALGDRIYDAFAPNGLLTQHDAEDPDALVHLGLTDQGEDVEINKRAAESDLLVYVNINLVAMDGGHKSVATGLASYKSLRHHHNPATMQQSRSFMDQHRSELHSSNWRMGRLIADSGVNVFQIETTLNNDTFPPAFGFLQKREWEWRAKDRLGYLASSKALDRTPARLARQIFHSVQGPPPDDLGAGRRGGGRARADHRQRLGPAGRGRSRARPTS